MPKYLNAMDKVVSICLRYGEVGINDPLGFYIHQHSKVYFPVTKGSLIGRFVESIHLCICNVRSQPGDKEFLLIPIQELASLWPIDNEEFAQYADDSSE